MESSSTLLAHVAEVPHKQSAMWMTKKKKKQSAMCYSIVKLLKNLGSYHKSHYLLVVFQEVLSDSTSFTSYQSVRTPHLTIRHDSHFHGSYGTYGKLAMPSVMKDFNLMVLLSSLEQPRRLVRGLICNSNRQTPSSFLPTSLAETPRRLFEVQYSLLLD